MKLITGFFFYFYKYSKALMKHMQEYIIYLLSKIRGKDMRIILAGLLSIILLFGLVACTDKDDASFNNIQSVYSELSLDNVSEIKVINGTTGNRISVTDEEQIKEIFDPFTNLSLKDTEQPNEESGGYTYNISFYNGEEKVLSVVYGGSNTDKLFINRHLYIVEDMCVIQSAVDLFNEYEE